MLDNLLNPIDKQPRELERVPVLRRALRWSVAAGAVVLAGLGACGRPPPPADPRSPPPDASPPATVAAPELRWTPCEPTIEGAQCATMLAPRSYDDPGAGDLELAIMRIPSDAPTGRQLWYLAGGPGGASTSLIPVLQERYGAAWSGVDLYAIDHRGTGGSHRVSCPEQEAPGSAGGLQIAPEELEPCLRHIKARQGDELPHLTVTNAARDLHRALQAARGEAQVVLWGNSYGTHWAHRFMQLYPEAVDGVFLEALVPAGASYRSFDHWMNDAGLRLMQACASAPACRERLTSDPVQLARELPARLEAGHCEALKLPVRVSWFLGSLTYDHGLRGMLPLLVHMLDRCGEADVARIQRMVRALFGDVGMLTAGDFSAPYYAHAVLSEMWSGAPPGGKTLEAVAASCLFCPGDRAEMERARPQWPTYEPDAFDDRVARYRGPLWMLQGGLDPAIPPAVAAGMGESFRGEGQHFIAFPTGAHTLTGKTPTPDGDCALALLSAFLDDPTEAPPTDCVAEVAPPPLPEGPPGLAAALLGEGDAWSGE